MKGERNEAAHTNPKRQRGTRSASLTLRVIEFRTPFDAELYYAADHTNPTRKRGRSWKRRRWRVGLGVKRCEGLQGRESALEGDLHLQPTVPRCHLPATDDPPLIDYVGLLVQRARGADVRGAGEQFVAGLEARGLGRFD